MLEESEATHFPYGDDQPMTDKDLNRLLMEATELSLKEHFPSDELTYVSANLFIYYNEADDEDRVAPDVFVVHGVANRPRESYKLWEEKQCPQVAFEFVSKSSKNRDARARPELYEKLGVLEYYAFDGTGQYLSPRFQAFRRQHGRLVDIQAGQTVFSPELGLELTVQGELLRLYRPGASLPMPLPSEWARLLSEAEAALQAERAQRVRLEAELQSLRRRLTQGP